MAVTLQRNYENFYQRKEISRSYGGIEHVILISSRKLCDFPLSAEARQRVRPNKQGLLITSHFETTATPDAVGTSKLRI
ncbi:hypothetical protein N7492_002168 [Penicillium capsulatum]|uniref:Uncharacterized protein n=1 Tax=Penicillium capsulatum TaxID=69766 RepID=A0A9W9LUV8_9EURO|nr:hypothetical protein N7492_002168 [Penicillium capsulatum]